MQIRLGVPRTLGAALLVGALSAPAQDDLSARVETGGAEWISRRDPLEVVLSRPVPEEEGRIAVLLDKSDLTDLFDRSGLILRYRPKLRPLPSGEPELVVFLVTPANEWTEIGRTKLKVRLPGGLEQATVTPKIDVTLKGQLGEGHEPESAAPPRKTFQDLTGQATLGVELGRGVWSLGYQMAVQGAQRQEEALRFPQEGTGAPQVDLSSWATKIGAGPATLEWGHVSFGESRHLINSFGSRGGRLSLALGNVATVAGAALNGTSIVGWDNFLGLAEAQHRVYAGTLGVEIVPSAPGTLRVEGTFMDGSLLPLANFNQGSVTDAEKSKGAGFRLLANLLGGRFRLEGGFARNRFEAPPDPLLDQGQQVVALAPTWRSAWYGNVAFDIVKGARLSETSQANVTLAVRRDRVDPQFRSVAVSVQSDLQQDAIELTAGLGPVTAQLLYGFNEDNLAEIVSILKTKTKRAQAQAALPLGGLFGGASPSWWLPQLTYGFGRTHQYAANDPPGGGFQPTHLPDQVSLNHTPGVEWQAGPARFGWKLNYSDQDNRQTGRETADFLNTANIGFVALQPVTFLDLGLEYGNERAAAAETGAVDRTERYQATVALRPLPPLSLTSNGVLVDTGNEAGTSDGRTWTVDVQAAWRFEPPRKGTHGLSGQLLLRYAYQQSRTRDLVFGVETFRKTWVVNSGVSLSLF